MAGEQAGGRRSGPSGTRLVVTLACSECKARNYKTTRSPDTAGQALELKKFCKQCKRHTLHRETK
jgi:large subunit ribosomal protein L33